MIKRLFFVYLLFPIFLFCEGEKKEKSELEEKTSVTSHQLDINGKTLSYTALAGNFLLKDGEDKNKASIFYIAYTKDGVDNKTKRPIMFCFNGGPGSSSIWLHMGTFGPRKVAITEEGQINPPYHFIDNPDSILDVTDLVFIDPVSSGYSRAAPGEDPKQFHGYEEDIKSVGEFIRLYLTRNQRWDSPKFVAGESYGTTRAAGLAGYLHKKQNIYLDGIVLVSSVLDFQTLLSFDRGNDLPYILFLPSYAATAWYHQKLDARLQKNLEKTLEEVEEFALKEYALALLQGDKIEEGERDKIIQKLSKYTGLSPEYIEKANLRIHVMRFVKELLRDKKNTVGRFDSRFKGNDSDSVGETFEYDPSFDAIAGGFTAAFNQYIREELKWKEDREYVIIADILSSWEFGDKAKNQYLNVANTLREVITRNQNLRVFVANGYLDLATPYFATDYTFNHLGLPLFLSEHITMKNYLSGHMLYIHGPSQVKFKKDLANFITSTLSD